MRNRTKLALWHLPLIFLSACGGTDNTSSDTHSVSSSSISTSISSSSISTSSSSSIAATQLELQVGSTDPCAFNGEIESEHTGHTGAGYWNSENQVNTGLLFSLENRSAEQTTIAVRYANGGTDNRPGSLRIGEQEFTLQFPPTNAWDQWATEAINFTAQEGEVTLSVTSLSANGLPNLDQILVTNGDWQTSDCPTAPDNGGNTPTPSDSPFSPTKGETNVSPDTFIAIRFDAPPSFSANGTVTIRRTSDNAVVDQINLAGDTDNLGYQGQNGRRALNRTPATVIGNELRIYPHSDVLQTNTQYSISIPQGIVSGTVNGSSLNAVNSNDWIFQTKPNMPNQATITVDDNGASDFRTVQGALNHIMRNNLNNVTVNIGPGQYYELLYLNGGQNIRLNGAGKDITRIFQSNAERLNSGSSGRPLFLVQNTDLLTLQNLTLHNTYLRNYEGGQSAQAETLYFNSSSGRLVAKNTQFKSEQDTLLLKGYSWFYQSTVIGNVDFIWGYPVIALFEENEIRSIGDSRDPNSSGGGYVVQARIENSSHPGVVFLNSRFTRGIGELGNQIGNGQTYLARSGNGANSTSRYDNVSFINCQFDNHIAAVGWFDESSRNKYPNPSSGNANNGLREYNSQNLNGQAINPNRDRAFYRLSGTEADAQFRDRQTIFNRVNNGGSWLNN